MDAMILAAGRGERMRPLSDSVPKPLLRAGNTRLIEFHLVALRNAGFSRIVVNTSYKGDLIAETLGDGSQYGVQIVYSAEGPKPLETGGGIKNALGLIDTDPFAIVNADIWTDFPFANLPQRISGTAHLILVANPAYYEHGDFGLEKDTVTLGPSPSTKSTLTFSGISVLTKELFHQSSKRIFPLRDMLESEIKAQRVTGTRYRGAWFDIGTPERLEQLDAYLNSS